MAERATFSSTGMSIEAEKLASRVFGPQSETPEVAGMRPAVVERPFRWAALAIFALALAIVFNAILFRYETQTGPDYLTVRTDRLTGRLVRCYGTTDLCHVQALLPPAGMGALPTR